MYGFHKRVEGYLKFPSPGDTISGQAPPSFTKEFQVCLITADQAPTLVIDAYAFRLYNPLAMPLFSRRPSTSMSAICRRAVLRLHRHSMA